MEKDENLDPKTPDPEDDSEPRKSESIHLSVQTWIGITAIFGIGLIAVIVYSSLGKYQHVKHGKFVGPKKCGECHEKEYSSWKTTRMANSFEVLRPGQKVKEKQMVSLDPDTDYTQVGECLSCHTTGYKLVGGFVSVEKTPDMVGVSCEACHGPGGSYIDAVMDPKHPDFPTEQARTAGLTYPPTERVCKVCHNSRSPYVGTDYKFDFESKKTKDVHQHFELQYQHDRTTKP